jgi:hypothetical protein
MTWRSDNAANVLAGYYVLISGRAPVSDFAPIVRIPPKSDNPSGAGGPPAGNALLSSPSRCHR